MKKFGQGMIVGFLLATLLISGIAWASNPIKLIVNGQEIKTDIAPQLINGRVLVPVRFVAEALGAKVEWDQKNQAVLITSLTLAKLDDSKDWLTIREVVELTGWQYDPDGYFVYNNIRLFHYADVIHKIEDNGKIFIHRDALNNY